MRADKDLKTQPQMIVRWMVHRARTDNRVETMTSPDAK